MVRATYVILNLLPDILKIIISFSKWKYMWSK